MGGIMAMKPHVAIVRFSTALMAKPVDISQGVVTVCEYASDRTAMNPFQENMKAMIRKTTSPGRTRGKDIDRSVS